MNHSPKVEVACLGEDPSSSVIGEAITGSPKKEVTGLRNGSLASVFGEETGGRRRRRSGFQSSTTVPQVLGFVKSIEKAFGIPRASTQTDTIVTNGQQRWGGLFLVSGSSHGLRVCSLGCSRLVLFGVSCVLARFFINCGGFVKVLVFAIPPHSGIV